MGKDKSGPRSPFSFVIPDNSPLVGKAYANPDPEISQGINVALRGRIGDH
jgi:hypothetical protein